MLLKADKIYEENSPVSGKIEVWQHGAERKLLVNGATQSIYRLDGKERGYWVGLVPENEIKSALLLGLGGGTVARILRARWPGVRIVSYELDPAVVRVATSYFALDPATEVRVADFREALRAEERFDLIVVDLYSGHRFLKEAESEEFMMKLQDRLNSNGMVAFNRIPVLINKDQLSEFESCLRKIFKEVVVKKADLNLIYWGKI